MADAPPPFDDSLAGAPGQVPFADIFPPQSSVVAPAIQPGTGTGIPAAVIDAAAAAPVITDETPPTGPNLLGGISDAVAGTVPALSDAGGALAHALGFAPSVADTRGDVSIESQPDLSLHDGSPQGSPLPSDIASRAAAQDANDDHAANVAMAKLGVEDPAALAEIEANHDRAQRAKEATDRVTLEQDNLRKANDNLVAYQKADAITQKKSDEVAADVTRIAHTPIDRNRWYRSLSTGQTIGAWISAIAGGIAGGLRGDGKNYGLDQIVHAIDQDVDAQKDDIANQKWGATTHQGLVAQEFARHGDLYRATETARLAGYQGEINKMFALQQNFDPRGTTAIAYAKNIQGMVARQTQAKLAMDQQNHKDEFERIKLAQEQQKIEETKREHDLQYDAKRLKLGLGAGGAGGATSAEYTVPTGFSDPFTKEPIMAKRPIGGKGEDPKERNAAAAAIDTYAHVQDGYNKLYTIGQRIGYHKSLGAQAWDRFKDTDTDEYEKATHSLVVYLTKEMGDRLTQGQIDEQKQRIPELAKVLSSVDPAKEIRDAQEDADRDFSRTMNVMTINPDPIIANAQRMRLQGAAPSAAAGYSDAADAAAAHPESKDARRALDDAHKREVAAVTAEQQQAQDIAYADRLTGASSPRLEEGSSRDAESTAAIRESNAAAERLDKLVEMYKKAATDQSYVKKGMRRGDVAAAAAKHHDETAKLAHDAVIAKERFDHDHDKAKKALFIPDKPPPPRGMGDTKKDLE